MLLAARSGSAGNIKTSWVYMDHLHFLDPFMAARPTSSNDAFGLYEEPNTQYTNDVEQDDGDDETMIIDENNNHDQNNSAVADSYGVLRPERFLDIDVTAAGPSGVQPTARRQQIDNYDLSSSQSSTSPTRGQQINGSVADAGRSSVLPTVNFQPIDDVVAGPSRILPSANRQHFDVVAGPSCVLPSANRRQLDDIVAGSSSGSSNRTEPAPARHKKNQNATYGNIRDKIIESLNRGSNSSPAQRSVNAPFLTFLDDQLKLMTPEQLKRAKKKIIALSFDILDDNE